MNKLETRLRRCFSAVFPGLPEDRIPHASLETVPEWDSVAHLTLVQVVEDEFHANMDEEETEQLTSFGAWLERLK